MAIIKTDALVLRRIDYSETSQIVAMLTPDAGRVDVIAKGSRKIWDKPLRSRPRIDGPIDRLTLNRIVYYESRNADGLHVLSEADLVHSFVDARRSLPRWYSALTVADLLLLTAEARDGNAGQFYAGVRAMAELAGPADPRVVTVDFFARLLAALGRAPDVTRCAATGAPLADEPEAVVLVRQGTAYALAAAPVAAPGGRVRMPGIATAVLARLFRGVRKPLHHVRLPDDVLLPLATLLSGMIVETTDRRPKSFRYLSWSTPAMAG
jgi:DNA repair protein RecO (recombination protein O)